MEKDTSQKEKLPGYHLIEIKKGELGKSSKLLEEVEELIDAEKQGCKIMVSVELADLVGAIILYLEKNLPNTTLEDLVTMSRITRRAFTNGRRT
jgi:NTP pyrophosphatase (non-canonical NTP hydrolase)